MIERIDLHAYADGELSAEERSRIALELEQSPESQAELNSILSLKGMVQSKCEVFECSGEWKACVTRLNDLDKVRKVEGFTSRYAWALCGAFFIFILIGGLSNRLGPATQSGDIARMVASLAPASAPASQEPAAVKRWLDGLLGQARQSVAPDRMNIVGAATGELDGRRVARLTLRDANGDLALLIVSDVLQMDELETMQENPQYKIGKVQSINCVSWNDGRFTMVLVADRPYAEMTEISRRMQIQ